MEVTPSETAALPVACAAPTLATAWGQDRPSPLTKLPRYPPKYLLPDSELYCVQDRIKSLIKMEQQSSTLWYRQLTAGGLCSVLWVPSHLIFIFFFLKKESGVFLPVKCSCAVRSVWLDYWGQFCPLLINYPSDFCIEVSVRRVQHGSL